MPGSNVGSHFLNGWEWQASIRLISRISPCTGSGWLCAIGGGGLRGGGTLPPSPVSRRLHPARASGLPGGVGRGTPVMVMAFRGEERKEFRQSPAHPLRG